MLAVSCKKTLNIKKILDAVLQIRRGYRDNLGIVSHITP